MRLRRIKLAGFKSFVDPTTFDLPSSLVGVTGPNGAGKSNLIDAVRWVMGESSARQLRGGQMTDVIFSGSSGRHPLSSASVEMVFDNNEGRLGGEYARFSEISIRRTVDREGISNYYLNGTRCRRRDITDVFLGTGLGPRSYSLIEQGIISKLVESKPEDLREFLEEAAGISRYKERRRETENRLRNTRENLERVDDLLDEIGKRLAHLKRQARAAERYQDLRLQQRKLRAELVALHLRRLDDELSKREDGARELSLAVETEQTRESSVERELAASRAEHNQAQARVEATQQRYFEQKTEIARLEAVIAGAEREHFLHEERLQTIAQQLQEMERRAGEGEKQANALQAEIEGLVPDLRKVDAEVVTAQGKAEVAAVGLADCQRVQTERREVLAMASRRLAVAEAEAKALQERKRGLEQRRLRLKSEQERQESVSREGLAEAAKREVSRLRGEAEAAEAVSAACEQSVKRNRQLLQEASESLADLRREQASVEARLDSLNDPLRAERDTQLVNQWLSDHGLSEARHLAGGLEIEPGWEWAVELVLGTYLEGIETDRPDTLLDDLRRLPTGGLTLIHGKSEGRHGAKESLGEHVNSPFAAIYELLDGIYAAATIEAAKERRSRLLPGESVITRDGTWMGRHWLRVARAADPDAGILARERKREQLKQLRIALSDRLVATQQLRTRHEEALRLAEAEFTQARSTVRSAQEALAMGLAAEAEAVGRERSAIERWEALREELAELDTGLNSLEEKMALQHQVLSRVRQEVEIGMAEQAAQETELVHAREEAEAARAATEKVRRVRESMALRLEALRVQADAAADTVARLCAEREKLLDEQNRVMNRLEAIGEPDAATRRALEAGLEQLRTLEAELVRDRNRSAAVEARATELESARRISMERVARLREDLETTHLAVQELRTRREAFIEQLAQLEVRLEQVLAEMEPGADSESWERRLEQVGQRIQRLGAINLAAIEEYTSEAEREKYLQQQRADLNEAMETLQSAIGRIDRETRSRFKETFDQINTRLNELFPRLFGGGAAALVLTGDDLLNAGVMVTAHPPGKRNTSVQMLSGGEKALVAVALVFAIFDLNPAPFCMLDEVDAPMDDANITRFCDLVHEISQRTQFIIITHNRSTMAACHQLIGVTMQEPGVSRLVGVDLDEVERCSVN